MAKYAAALDQGTTSSRCMVFDHGGQVVSVVQKEREQVGLPLATYFSGPKVRWILDNVDGAADRAEAGDLLFGNIDTWCIWNLTGGPDGGIHITDVSNASRTMLMDLETLDWDEGIASTMGVPTSMLPEVRPSSAPYGEVRSGGGFQGVQIAGDLGDQQAATFGQTCFAVGEAKNTYGTGNFLLLNTGNEPVQSKSGLMTKAAPEVEELASSVDDNGGLYIVPAFSGLFAPYWKSNARGVFAGLTRYV